MKRVLLVLSAGLLLFIGGRALVRALASDETHIRWLVEDMAEGFDHTRTGAILGGLERDELSRGGRPTLSGAAGDQASSQLGLFARPADDPGGTSVTRLDIRQVVREDEVARRLKATDLNDTTPRQALELLAELKQLAEDA